MQQQQFTFSVCLSDEQLAELDRFARDISEEGAEPASREEAAAVCVVSKVNKGIEQRKGLWLGKQRWLEGLARKHGFVMSKDLPILNREPRTENQEPG